MSPKKFIFRKYNIFFFWCFFRGRSLSSVTVKWQEICQLLIQKYVLHVKAQKTVNKAARIGQIPSHGRGAPTPVVIITEIKERVAKNTLIYYF